MDVTEFLRDYGSGGVQVALLGMFFWFVKDIAQSIKGIPAAIASTTSTHREEVEALARSQRESVQDILRAHAQELTERDRRWDAFVLDFVRARETKDRSTPTA